MGNSSISNQLLREGLCEWIAGASVQLHFYPLHPDSFIYATLKGLLTRTYKETHPNCPHGVLVSEHHSQTPLNC